MTKNEYYSREPLDSVDRFLNQQAGVGAAILERKARNLPVFEDINKFVDVDADVESWNGVTGTWEGGNIEYGGDYNV